MITVLGAGAFGTAMAQLLATNGHNVTLWCHETDGARSLHNRITTTLSLHEAFHNAIIFEAIPVAHIRSVLERARPYITTEHRWVILSKGMESSFAKASKDTEHSCLLPSEIITQLFPEAAIAVLSGPSYAREVATQQPTHVTLAATDCSLAETIRDLVTNEWFTVEFSEDIVGVQLCAAYKNVAALYLGMLAGAGYGENTQALAFMRCLHELRSLLAAAGAEPETIYSPAGLGDMVLTCYGKQSRNHAAGVLFGKGEPLSAIIAQLGTEPEGINSAVALQQWAQKNNLTLAIGAMVHEIIFNSKSVADLVAVFK